MSLKNRKFPTKSLMLSDGGDPVSVRGLSLSLISEIVLTHREDALAMFSAVMDSASKPTVNELAQSAEAMVLKFPNIIAHVIAIGTGDRDAFQEALDLPLGDQVMILREIGALTFTTNGGMGNVLEAVISLLQNVNSSLAK